MQTARVATSVGSGARPVVAPPRPNPRRSRVVANSLEPSTMEAIGLVSQLATTAAVCGAAFMLLREQPLPEQDRLDSRSQPCPVCNGSGYEECLCSRWSDGDRGCNGCNATGYMRCRGCGGGGTAVPLLVKVRK